MNKRLICVISLLLLFGYSAIAQESRQKASIMVIPSDNLLNQLGCLDFKETQGGEVIIRNYQKAFIKHANLKFVISRIKESFAERGYPLKDLEQTLKGINTEKATDNIESFDRDPKALALKTARPDIILDLTYELLDNGLTNQLVFNIEAIDAYTKKTISSASHPGLEVNSTNVPKMIQEQVELNMNNLQDLINKHFKDIASNGREITLRIVSENQAVSDFRRDRLCGEKNLPVGSWMRMWLKKNTKNGYGKLVLNSAKELKFDQIRIPLQDKDGYPISASEWSFKLIDNLLETCNLIGIDYSSGLGEAVIVITE